MAAREQDVEARGSAREQNSVAPAAALFVDRRLSGRDVLGGANVTCGSQY
jgi:hypothetical protein